MTRPDLRVIDGGNSAQREPSFSRRRCTDQLAVLTEFLLPYYGRVPPEEWPPPETWPIPPRLRAV